MIFKLFCVNCGLPVEIEADAQDYRDWQNGKLAQDAFPYLTPGEREMFISRICDTCWDSMFGEYE